MSEEAKKIKVAFTIVVSVLGGMMIGLGIGLIKFDTMAKTYCVQQVGSTAVEFLKERVK